MIENCTGYIFSQSLQTANVMHYKKFIFNPFGELREIENKLNAKRLTRLYRRSEMTRGFVKTTITLNDIQYSTSKEMHDYVASSN